MFKKVIIFLFAGFCFFVYGDDFVKNGVAFAYPDWKMKALSFSYDDGHIADRQLVAIFNKYGMKGTFHIPHAWLQTKPKKRISEAEINTLYKGHEISGHGANHLHLAKMKKSEIEAEIKADISGWEKITGKKITGYAYPYGSFSPEVISVLKNNGLIYARTVGRDKNFELPADFLAWNPYGHHKANIAEAGKKYLQMKPDKMTVMLVWGHSYEFKTDAQWNVIEDFCRQMSGKDDIFYASMGEIASYVNACRQAVLSKNGKMLKNNSDKQLYFLYKGNKLTAAADSEYDLNGVK